jgi:NAD(P)-dependent dehydrogenase (short-subunit alcohol dehydrogenase family)
MALREPPGPLEPMLAPDEFAGKVVLVTGGGSGVGLAMARGFALCGAAIAITSRKQETLDQGAAELRGLGARVVTIPGDVRDRQAVTEMFDRAEAELGLVDFLLNNAGSNFAALAENLSVNAWRAITQIALDGTFFCSQEFHRRRRDAELPGAIVNNLASYAWTGLPGGVHSAAAKAGALNLTLTLATEWARDRVRVNSIVVGTYPHARVPNADRSMREGRRGLTVPAGRALRAQELGWSAAFLCSRFADFVTGLNLVVDGGDWLRRDLLKPEFVPPRERNDLWIGR